MPIESRIPTEEINVKDLQIEQPEGNPVGLSFDVEKELSVNDWKQITEDAESWKQEEESLDIYLDFAAAINGLSPEHRLQLNERDWEVMVNKLDSRRSGPDFYKSFAGTAADIKSLFPKEFKEHHLVKDMDLQALAIKLGIYAEKCMEEINSETLGDYLGLAVPLKTIAPDFFDKLPDNKKMEKVLMNPDVLETYKTIGSSLPQLAEHAASVKILFPHAKLAINQSEWQSLLQELRKMKSDAKDAKVFWPRVVSYARNLQILAAQELRFTDEGIKAVQTTGNDLNEKISSLPEIKKF